MSTTVQTENATAAQRTLDVLRERGWTQGHAEGPGGAVCLAVAMSEPNDDVPEYVRLCGAVVDEIDGSIVRWNDAPGRTFEDVEDLLRKLGAR